MENNQTILVSIRCLVYNHEPYLRQCLDGFIMQKTNFAFEAIVHDDVSTDHSVDIIREYAKKYPDIIKPIYETENQYSKHDGSIGRIMDANCRGKYVAICEGDDYWTDPYKLQKQIDFLESHPDYSLCFHNAMIHYEDSDKPDELFADLDTREYFRYELIKKWLNPTASYVYRREVLDSEQNKRCLQSKKMMAGDLPLILAASYCGKLYGMKETMSVYRKNQGGIMNTWTLDTLYRMCEYYIELEKIFGKDLHKALQDRVGKHAGKVARLILSNEFVKGIQLWRLIFAYAPLQTLKYTFIIPLKRVLR